MKMASANSFAIVLKAMVVGDANLTLTSVNLIRANTEVHVGTPLITILVRAPKATVDVTARYDFKMLLKFSEIY